MGSGYCLTFRRTKKKTSHRIVKVSKVGLQIRVACSKLTSTATFRLDFYLFQTLTAKNGAGEEFVFGIWLLLDLALEELKKTTSHIIVIFL